METQQINRFSFKADASLLVQAYLRAVNGVIGLTNRELEIMQFIVEAVQETREITTEDRENIRTVLDISSFDLNNYLSKLKKKGAILQKETGLFVNPKLIPVFNEDGVSVQIDIYADGR